MNAAAAIVDRISPVYRWGLRHPAWYYTAPLVVWALLIAVMSLMPPSQLRVGGLISDKLGHGLIYAVFATLLLRGWVRRRRVGVQSCLWVGLVATFWGLYLEILQHWTPHREFDWFDGVANTVGVLAGLAGWMLWMHWSVRLGLPAEDTAPASGREDELERMGS